MNSEALYIGNATRQNLEFHYRIAKDAPAWNQPIPAGTQIRIPKDLTPAQSDYVVRQMSKYGIVAADSIDQARGFHGTCYAIGQPIKGMKLALLMEHNLGELVKMGREIREQTAVAQNNMLETTLIENGRPERLTQMDLTIQQEDHDARNSVPQLSEGFRVVRGSDRPAPQPKSRRRAA